MGVVRVMAVGKSGVGKSTIGNCLLTGSPTGGVFETSPSAESCTQSPKWRESENSDFAYCDVPGIPDTNADNTKKFYDMIIEEARKDLTVLLFVFKYERIDNELYSRAKMLFRELKKSNVVKVLVINDMNNYAFGSSATKEHYETLEKEIKAGTGMSFQQVISFTGQNLEKEIKAFKKTIKKWKAQASPDLKTYVELKRYVEELTEKKNYEEVAYKEAKENIKRLKDKVSALKNTVIASTATAAAATAASFFTFGVTLEVAAGSAALSVTAGIQLALTLNELEEAEGSLSPEKLEEAKKELENACKSFKELDDALTK